MKQSSRGRRLLAVCWVSACCLLGAPVTNDLWDSSQPGFANLTLNPGLTCGAASNLFGTALGGTSCASGFAEGLAGSLVLGAGAGTVNVFQWDTAAMNLTQFELNYAGDSDIPQNRLLGRLQLSAWNGSSFVQFYDSGVGTFLPGTSVLNVTLGAPVTASRWQATFTNTNVPGVGFPEARLVELDGFGTLVSNSTVPEPGTLAGAALGLAMVAVYRRRKTRT